jgi:ketosteroid isomerase-like protein
MKNLFVILAISALCFACQQNNPPAIASNPDSLRNVLMNVDKKWSETAAQKGFNKSRVDFADDHAINLMTGEMPLRGKEDVIKYASNNPDTGYSISWSPVMADVSSSGDLGYTFGGWSLQRKNVSGRDTTIYGNYLTVWKKQSNGEWKYVADGGNSTPEKINAE